MYAHLLYDEVRKAETCLKKALNTVGLEIKIMGVLGKRTRFQEKFIPQLVIRVSFITGAKLSLCLKSTFLRGT